MHPLFDSFIIRFIYYNIVKSLTVFNAPSLNYHNIIFRGEPANYDDPNVFIIKFCKSFDEKYIGQNVLGIYVHKIQ